MMGRPPKPKDEVKSAELRIRLTEADRAELDRAAGMVGQETSTWARGLLLAAAGVTGKRGGRKSGRARRT